MPVRTGFEFRRLREVRCLSQTLAAFLIALATYIARSAHLPPVPHLPVAVRRWRRAAPAVLAPPMVPLRILVAAEEVLAQGEELPDRPVTAASYRTERSRTLCAS
jgi:hypothetical protein